VIYAIDAVGLLVHSKESEAARVITLGGAQGLGDAKRNSGAWTKDVEDQSAAVSSRSVAALGRLARETGGTMVDNTNDLARVLSSIQMERRTYYLLEAICRAMRPRMVVFGMSVSKSDVTRL
jgi:hypothetical protein